MPFFIGRQIHVAKQQVAQQKNTAGIDHQEKGEPSCANAGIQHFQKKK